MKNTLWAVITSGYTVLGTLGKHDPNVLCVSERQDIAEMLYQKMRKIGESLGEIGGVWIPYGTDSYGAMHYIAPSMTILIEADNDHGKNWSAILSEEKDFPLDFEENTYTLGKHHYHKKPSDITPCANLRFRTATKEQLQTIIKVHKADGPDSDGKMVYFQINPETNIFYT